MAVRPVLKFPDPGLRRAAVPVDRFDDDLRRLAEDLVDTMGAAQGIGITAPHVGIFSRLMAVRLSPEDAVRYYVNPQIVWSSEETHRHREGSVSMQDVLEEIERPARIRISYRDLTGSPHIEEADGLLSTCLQHEIDQLDGIFWIDKLSRLRRERLVKRYEKLQRLQG